TRAARGVSSVADAMEPESTGVKPPAVDLERAPERFSAASSGGTSTGVNDSDLRPPFGITVPFGSTRSPLGWTPGVTVASPSPGSWRAGAGADAAAGALWPVTTGAWSMLLFP